MSKRTISESTEVMTVKTGTLESITHMTPAAVLGTSTKMEIAESVLPAEFQGVELETIDSGFDPTVKWNAPGNYAGGVFTGFVKEAGPNKSRLYSFDANGKTFGIWGTTVLDKMFDQGMLSGQIQPGRKLLVIYMGDVETDKQPAKLFTIKIAKVKTL
jgi:hypothetical protein